MPRYAKSWRRPVRFFVGNEWRGVHLFEKLKSVPDFSGTLSRSCCCLIECFEIQTLRVLLQIKANARRVKTLRVSAAIFKVLSYGNGT
jgi:hypothetical protein